jgi:hypothetical protein
MARLNWTQEAETWLRDIYEYIAQDNPVAAARVVEGIRRVGASNIRRLILLLSVGWLPPYLPPSGACLTLGSSMP